MAVEADTVQYDYVGNGISTSFPFPAKFLSPNDIAAGIDGVELMGGYTPVGAGSELGGSVSFAVAPALGARVTLLRAPPLSQLTGFREASATLASTVENSIDKLTMIAQAQRYDLSLNLRKPRFAVADTPYEAGGARISNIGRAAAAGDAVNTLDLEAYVDKRYQIPVAVNPLSSQLLNPTKNPDFGFAGGSLAQKLYFFAGEPIIIPTGKQLDLIRNQNTFTVANGSRVSTLDFEMSVSGGDVTSNSYGIIGALYNSGGLSSKAIYGRVVAEPGCTADAIVALVGGVVTRPGVGLSVGAQITLDSMSSGKSVDYGIWLQGGTHPGGVAITAVEFGILIHSQIAIQQAGLRMFAGVGGSVGKFLHLSNATGAQDLFTVADTGAMFSNGLGTFNGGLNATGNISINGTTNTLRFVVADRTWSMQALEAGGGADGAIRILASGTGEVLRLGVGSLPRIRVSGALYELSAGLADSAGTGYRQVRFSNNPV